MRQDKGKRKSDKVAEKRHEEEYIATINSLTSGDTLRTSLRAYLARSRCQPPSSLSA